ncbi:hypothetical protein [Lacinutrix himadriensis]|uniref:hypothetical protein n=1 Tax=Lacinutrix himadriensis TaxID=641549 RepID=UPI0006E3F957|nr:hypothetical protein [Lacinutrix himadriensis]
MSIKINLIKNPGFVFSGMETANQSLRATASTAQNQQFKNMEIQNGYGTATTVSVSPGLGAEVTANIRIEVTSVSEESFKQIIEEVKKSSSYKNNSNFQKEVNGAAYSSAASSSSGIFGWLVGKSSSSYSNSSSNLTEKINKYDSGDAHNDVTVANSVANIMVKSASKVLVTSSVKVTGQLLHPSPTVIAVESTVFSFTKEDGSTSSVTMLNQTPLVPVDASNGTVSGNTLAAGSKIKIGPIGS